MHTISPLGNTRQSQMPGISPFNDGSNVKALIKRLCFGT